MICIKPYVSMYIVYTYDIDIYTPHVRGLM